MRVQECDSHPLQCLYVYYNGDYLDIVESYKRAWFCVQPMGDTPTRSALSDCFATGLVRSSFWSGLGLGLGASTPLATTGTSFVQNRGGTPCARPVAVPTTVSVTYCS